MLLTRISKAGLVLLVAVVLIFGFSGCGGDTPSAPADNEEEAVEQKPPIVVSSKTFPEALTLGYLTYEFLRDRGYEVVDETGLGEVAVIRPAIEAGEVDIYWEYTGTGLMNVMQHDEVVTDPEETFELIKDWDLENNNLVWLDYAPANNTFVLFISQEMHEQYGWTKLSELAEFVGQGEEPVALATSAEWMERADGLPNFQEHYNFEFRSDDIMVVELGLTYQAVGAGQADVGIGDATEGRIASFDLVVLEDDKLFFPAYNPAPVVRKEILETYPELEDELQELTSLLDLETLTMLNKKVAVENLQPENVAKDFLVEKALIAE